MTNDGNRLLAEFELPDGGYVGFYLDPDEEVPAGRWSWARAIIHRPGCPDIVVESDYLDHLMTSLHALLQQAREGLLPQHFAPDQNVPMGLLFGKDSASLEEGAVSAEPDPFANHVVWSEKGNISFLYREGNHVVFEVSPLSEYIFGDWPDDIRDAELQRFFADFRPLLLSQLPMETVRSWLDQLATLQQKVDRA